MSQDETPDPQRKAFLDMILEPPPRLSCFGVFADWLEEKGELDLAFAYRWCVEVGAKPYPPADTMGNYSLWSLGMDDGSSEPNGLYGNLVYGTFMGRRNKANASTFEQTMNLLADTLKQFRLSMGGV